MTHSCNYHKSVIITKMLIIVIFSISEKRDINNTYIGLVVDSQRFWWVDNFYRVSVSKTQKCSSFPGKIITCTSSELLIHSNNTSYLLYCSHMYFSFIFFPIQFDTPVPVCIISNDNFLFLQYLSLYGRKYLLLDIYQLIHHSQSIFHSLLRHSPAYQPLTDAQM